MKYISICLTVIILVLLCGCGQPAKATGDDEPAPEVSVYVPGDDEDASYDEFTDEETDASEAVTSQTNSVNTVTVGMPYYANTNTKKFHHSDCRYAKQISHNNLYTTNRREELINDGYEPCKVCNP